MWVRYSANDDSYNEWGFPWWRIRVALNPCYHGNKELLYRSDTDNGVFFLLPLSVVLYKSLSVFLQPPHTLHSSLTPLFPKSSSLLCTSSLPLHPISLPFASFSIHSFMLPSPHLQGPPTPSSLTCFSFTLTFLPLSLNSFMSALSPQISSPSPTPFITFTTCHVLLFASFPSSISIYLCLIFLHPLCTQFHFLVHFLDFYLLFLDLKVENSA